MLLSYRTIPHAGKSRSPSEMMGRQLRSLSCLYLTMSFESGSPLWYCQSGISSYAVTTFSDELLGITKSLEGLARLAPVLARY